MGRGSSSKDRARSLRSQLLVGLGVLLLVGLLSLAFVLLLWIPTGRDPLIIAAGMAGLALLIVGVLLLFADFLLRRLLIEPLTEMVRDAERIAEGDHSHRLQAEGPAELGRFARSMNEMANRLIEHKRELAKNVESLNETNRALTEARDELIRAEKLASVGRLAAGLAHEIGNPLNAITTYVEIGRRRSDGEPEWLEEIGQEADRIDRIVTGLLEYARPQDGPSVSVEMNEVIRDTVDLLHNQGRFEGTDLEERLEPELPKVRANPFHLQQVLVNLMLNALDAVEGEGGRVVVRSRTGRYRGPEAGRFRPRRADDPEDVDYSHIRRFHSPARRVRPGSLREGDPVVVVEVLDEGPGLPTEDPERVFDPFFTTKDPGKGTGLGLSVCARLVAQMDGHIEGGNREESGAVFTVQLPAVEERPEKSLGMTRSDETEARR